MKKIDPHRTYPLRRIVGREVQSGKAMVVMVCEHAVPGVPESRYSRFYPCRFCYEKVQAFKRGRPA
jgi:hypothetical protein